MSLNVTDQPFRYLGEFDTSFFLKQLNTVKWEDYIDRQENRLGMQDTHTIPIVWDLNMKTIRRWPIYDLFENEIQKVNELLTSVLGAGVIYTCVLTKLSAGKQIDLHYDDGKFFRNSSRVHIPVVTNEQTFFQVGNEVVNMKVNEMWEICNHGMLHGTYNNGTTDRIHLMFDWVY
jgi:hypothetical protein